MGRMKELKEKRAAIYQQIDDLRRSTDGRAMNADERAQWDKLTSEHSEVSDQILKEEQFAEIEARQAEHDSKEKAQKDADKEYRSAFREYLLKGINSVSQEAKNVLEERAALTGGLAGGALIPSSMSSAVEVALKSYGGVFEAGEIITTTKGGDLFLPTVNDTASKATIVAEYDESDESSPSFTSKKLSAHTYRTKIIPISLELLQDSNYDISSLIVQLLADQFGRGVNEHLTTGTGSGQPQGIVTAATKAVDAAADSITFDNVLDLMSSVDASYASNGKFMFKNQTLYALMKIKDSNGQYIWQPGVRDGVPATIFGKEYVLNDDMKGIEASAVSMIFGDLSKYKIRMVRNFQVLRLNELLAKYLSIGIIGFGRLDGILLDAGTNPVKSLQHASA